MINNTTGKPILTMIMKVIDIYLPELPQAAYRKDKEHNQSVLVETACDRLDINYLLLENLEKHDLHQYCAAKIAIKYKELAKEAKAA